MVLYRPIKWLHRPIDAGLNRAVRNTGTRLAVLIRVLHRHYFWHIVYDRQRCLCKLCIIYDRESVEGPVPIDVGTPTAPPAVSLLTMNDGDQSVDYTTTFRLSCLKDVASKPRHN